jgi:glycosyltransferase involved in cell wall biosynthesis
VNHTFVVPAYGDSPYLGECLNSIQSQTDKRSLLILATSTPSAFLTDVAQRFGATLFVNPLSDGIASDWNFALSLVSTKFVTIGHQDDFYHATYVGKMFDAIDRHRDLLIAFSNSSEHTSIGPREVKTNLRIKRFLTNRAFGTLEAIEDYRAKRGLLSFGNPVCCPSVVINRELLPDFRFTDQLKSNLDWDAWARLAEMKGKFVYVKTELVSKRVHAGSETSALIANQLREREDRLMFGRFWPSPVAAAISAVYKFGYFANRV